MVNSRSHPNGSGPQDAFFGRPGPKPFRIRTSRQRVRKSFRIRTCRDSRICIKTNDFNPLRICTYKLPSLAQKTKDFKSTRISTYAISPSNLFRIRTYKKGGGEGGTLLSLTRCSPFLLPSAVPFSPSCLRAITFDFQLSTTDSLLNFQSKWDVLRTASRSAVLSGPPQRSV